MNRRDDELPVVVAAAAGLDNYCARRAAWPASVASRRLLLRTVSTCASHSAWSPEVRMLL